MADERIYLGSKDQITEILDTDAFVIVTSDGIRKMTKSQVMEKLGINELNGKFDKLSEEMEELTKELSSGTGSGTSWTSTQITLLETIGSYLVFSDSSTGQALFDNLITSLRNSASSSGSSNNGSDDNGSTGNSGSDDESGSTYTITNSLVNMTTDNTAESVEANGSYTANLTADSNYYIASVMVTMGGVDVTSTVYSDGTITIDEVTGNIIIMANGASSVLYVLSEPTTFDGTSYVDTGVQLGTEEMYNQDWSILLDLTVTTDQDSVVFHTGVGSRGIAHVYCATHPNISCWAVYFAASNNNGIFTWRQTCVETNRRYVINHNAGENYIYVSTLDYNNELQTTQVTKLANYGFEGNFQESTVIIGADYTEYDGDATPGFVGTVNDFKIYRNTITEAEIAEYMGV